MHKLIKKHHQAIIRYNSDITLRQVPTPKVTSENILLKVLYAGLCGTDIQIFQKQRNDSALIIGHEGLTEIVGIDKSYHQNFKIGDKVIINPTHPTNPNLLLGHTFDGLFQEYISLPKNYVIDNLIIPCPENFPDSLSCLIEPLAAVIYAFELFKLHDNGTLIIYGDGIIGHLAILFIKLHFAKKIATIFVHHTSESLQWSFSHHIHGDLDILFNDIAFHNVPFNSFPPLRYALIATPRVNTLACVSDALLKVSNDGHIDILGGLPNNAELPCLPGLNLTAIRGENCGGIPKKGAYKMISVLNKNLILFGHRGVSNQHIEMSINQLRQHADYYSKLVTHTLNLNSAAKFIQNLSLNGVRKINDQRVLKLNIQF